MKKFVALLLAVLMISCMSMTVFAEETDSTINVYDSDDNLTSKTTTTNTENKDVTVEVKAEDGAISVDPTYYVVLTWEDLTFTYTLGTKAENIEWDPITHQYVDKTSNTAVTGTWSCSYTNDAGEKVDNGTNNIENAVVIANHSDAEISVEAKLTKTATTNGVTTTLSNTEGKTGAIALASGVGVQYMDAAKAVYDVSVGDSVPTDITASSCVVANISVTISAGDSLKWESTVPSTEG